MIPHRVPERRDIEGALGPFSSRTLKRSQSLNDGTEGAKRKAPLPVSWLGIHFLPVCSVALPPPHLEPSPSS